jgi:predicted permease
MDLKQNGYDEPRGRAFYRRLLDEVRRDPGTESATLSAYEPLAFLDTPSRRVAIDGYEPRRDEDIAFLSNIVGPDYFRTLRIDLAAGRSFEDRDDAGAAPVAIVNATLANKYWSNAANAIGKRLRVADGEWRTVVGVAADIKYVRINESPRPYVYLPFLQSYRSSMILHTRGPAPADALVAHARAHVAALDANLPILYAKRLEDRMDGALLLFNLMATMLFVFGLAGMALAALGTYGLVSYVVKQSTLEIGIRMALGASGRSIVSGFVGRGLKLGAIGASLGIAVALAMTRLLGSALFGVSATDATSFLRALAVVLGGVIIASLVPAWRAARTNPLTALHHR